MPQENDGAQVGGIEELGEGGLDGDGAPDDQGVPAAPVQQTEARKMRSLNNAVNRKLASQEKERDLSKREEALKPLAALHDMVQKGDLLGAVKALTGGDKDPAKLLALYEAAGPEVLGLKGDEDDWAKLPKGLREKLERYDAMAERLTKLDALENEMAMARKQRDTAYAAIEARQAEDAGTQMFTVGANALDGEDGEFIRSVTGGQEMLQEKWGQLVAEKAADPAFQALSLEERKKLGVELVGEAARLLREETYRRFGNLLRPAQVGGNMRKRHTPRPSASAQAPDAPPATRTPSQAPRTVTSGGLEAPRAIDLSGLSMKQRIALLRKQERQELKTRG